MSPPTNTASRYTHKFCTINQFSIMSVVLESFWIHNWISFLNGALYLEIVQVIKQYRLLHTCYLLLMRDPNTIRESSINETTSDVSFPFSSNSPLVLKEEKLRL